MPIDYDILIAYGGTVKKYSKGSVIFLGGDIPYFFYQIEEGEVKVFSASTEGKELIQGIFKSGESFGEPPLLLNKCYPTTAMANCDSIIVRISKEKLLNILKDYPDIANRMLFIFAERIYKKICFVQTLISHTPEQKILAFFKEIKGNCKEKIMINYTRQQIADFTGMRVETVIRTLIKMNEEKKVDIINHKVFY